MRGIGNSETEGLKSEVDKKVSVRVVKITATTGTGGAVGNMMLSKSDYPNAKAIITGADDSCIYISTGVAQELSSGYFLLSWKDIRTNVWAPGVSITFNAAIIE